MPSLTGLARVARLVNLPETRKAVAAAARSRAVRELARRAAHDRAALMRDLRHPTVSRAGVRSASSDALRSAVHHPATRELASAALLLLPGRLLPLGVVASWATRRFLRRLGPDSPTQGSAGTAPTSPEAAGAPRLDAQMAAMDVPPRGSDTVDESKRGRTARARRRPRSSR
jgi:hypothetical protein